MERESIQSIVHKQQTDELDVLREYMIPNSPEHIWTAPDEVLTKESQYILKREMRCSNAKYREVYTTSNHKLSRDPKPKVTSNTQL